MSPRAESVPALGGMIRRVGDFVGRRAELRSLLRELRGERRGGDYAQAEQRYQDSLTILEELGDRAGIASTTSQLGVLRTEQGQPAEGIRYNISAFVIRLELGSPEVSIDLYWLGRQRQEVGDEAFAEILGDLLDADGVKLVIDAVDRFQQGSDPG